ncbi:MFS sugar transporter-like protein [Ilyonectria sp. MPI-CAGE-AT-0026]|nr:MFS sugar transporter-like protein [Ilyonectria sp. MPI-CAGE-AT-0026]
MHFSIPLPERVSSSSTTVSALLVLCSSMISVTAGYDGSMMNALNILPAYTEYFQLNNATLGLATAAMYIGGFLGGMVYSKVTDILGRKPSLFLSYAITAIAAVIQGAAQNIAMFVVGRILVGFGNGCSTVAAPTYIAETLPHNWRAWGLGIMNDFYYVGGLLAAGVTYGTSQIDSTWAWRIPSLLQVGFSIMCILILPFVPESPRWLLFQDRREAALKVVAQTHSDGDVSHPVVLAQYQQMVDVLNYEKDAGESLSFIQIFKTPSARKRLLLVFSCALATMIPGNSIVSYYFGAMLNNAGITSADTQLQINIILNAFCLVCALAGTFFADIVGRRPNALWSTGALTVCLYIVGALTKQYGTSDYVPGIYATVAFIFLFMGAYSFGWTPLCYLYPPEVLNYAVRANGMGVFTSTMYGSGILLLFTYPFALEAMGWTTYMMNASWNILLFLFIYFFWVETKGKTLEEIDEVIEGVKHTDVPNLENIIKGKEDINIASLEIPSNQ